MSAYPHAPGGTANRAKIDLGIGQLSAAARSAQSFYEWLLSNQHRLGVPLATIRLLLSPSTAEVFNRPELKECGDRCTLQNFLAAAAEWRDDAASHPENVTLFYFAGHGAQRTRGDSVLLMENFGDGIGGPLRNAVDMKNIVEGMAPSTTRNSIARTQVYFVDCCRVRPNAFRDYQYMQTSSAFDVEELQPDNRHTPIFFAAIPNTPAYAVPGEQAAFSAVLLAALEGDAIECQTKGGEEIGRVTVRSLDAALQTGVMEWNRKHSADQEYALEGMTKDTVIFQLARSV